MKSHAVAALGITALLVMAGAALSSLADPADAPEAPAATPEAPAGGHGHGGGAHAWSGGTGRIPTFEESLFMRPSFGRIVIGNDSEFNPSKGVSGGTGAFEDPFVISGVVADSIHIHDTTKAFVIKDSYIRNILVLDWTGQGGYVHHNHIENLRTNRNVPRTGDPTAAVIEKNQIGRVEELRHFDGVVAHNVIGRPDALPLLSPKVVFNIAGLNGAGIHDNVVYGGVDMKIHGHHHSDARGLHSHNHGRPDEVQGEDHAEDHQVRYVDFLFARNTIIDKGFGLRYNDLNHAGDDRTATSEEEPDLEKPHVHHTLVTISGNTIDGAALAIKVLNSDDERHLPGQTAELLIEGNKIVQRRSGDGIVVSDVRDATVRVSGNKVSFVDGLLQQARSGVRLEKFWNASVEVVGNDFGPYAYGVAASAFDVDVVWTVAGNTGKAKQPVYWDDTVPNPPGGDATDAPHDHDHGHDHSPSDGIQAVIRT